MIINRPFLWGLIFVCCCFVLSSCEEKAKPFRNETYQTLDGNLKIKIYSKDELEYKESSTPNIVAKYTIEEGDKLRVVIQFLGTTQAMYYKIVQEGLKAGDGTILYSTKYYEKERKRRELAKKRAQEKKENEARLARLKIERETNLAKAALGGDVATVNDLLGECQ